MYYIIFPDCSGVPIPGEVVSQFGLGRDTIPMIDLFMFLKWKEEKSDSNGY